jgi:hypothetical protein
MMREYGYGRRAARFVPEATVGHQDANPARGAQELMMHPNK